MAEVCIPHLEIIFLNSRFIRNFARHNGGGLYNYKGLNTIHNNNFSSNAAYWDGGGIYLEESNTDFYQNIFSANYSDEDG